MSRLDLEQREHILLESIEMKKKLFKRDEKSLTQTIIEDLDHMASVEQELLEVFSEDRIKFDLCR